MSTPAFALPQFTDDQLKVLDALAKGANLNAAARSVAVHRTTLHHWRRTNPAFDEAVRNARHAHRSSVQVDYEAMADKALATVQAILDDPKASASVRLRAAHHIINKLHEPMIDAPTAPVAVALPAASYRPSPDPEPIPDDVPVPAPAPEPPAPLVDLDPDYDAIHAELDRIEAELNAGPDYLQPIQTIRREGPKVGRNDTCPCNSGRKYKKCCGK